MGRCDPKRRRTKGDLRSTSMGLCGWVGVGGGGGAGELGGLRLYYKCFEKHGYFSKFGPSKLIIFCRDNFIIIC